MKAASRYYYGSPTVLVVEDIPKPECASTELLVRVHASSVNRTDSGFLLGKPFVTRFFSGLPNPKYPVLGCEFAGEVEKVGSEVTLFKKGDRVFGFDDVGWGGHGQYKCINQNKSVALIPKNITYQQAAVCTEGAHYALSYIHTIKKLGAKTVLVHGATGAIGSAAVQLLKLYGFYVVATSTTKCIALVKSFGADDVIDWQKTDFTKYPMQFDVVFDAVGKSRFSDCKRLLVKKGVYIATELGPHGQNPFLGMATWLYKLVGAKRVLFPLPKNNKQIIEEIALALENRALTPVIDKTYDLKDIQSAYDYVLTGQKIGNVSILLPK